MQCRLSDLRRLELIDLLTGDRLGYADDFAVDTETGRLTALVQYGKERAFGLFGRAPDRELPYHAVRLIGSQTILVQATPPLPTLDASDPLAPYREPLVRASERPVHWNTAFEQTNRTRPQ